ncbi:NADPH-cytochrome P450 reductase [Entomortierella chlamydospora]|uniref:NADPH--cytochrome P450 reductase n=1 Tax=Entomortierella chlamydospora TaxID=101097 RepID=A0A9P6MRM8_9FUNG|nr:NADPH-cytochrome P450 reductase [Entomortierella chlamydospora]KAG0011210.1 NADPH-cytochrome P450 reductase [Entomortierella chlamydospora]
MSEAVIDTLDIAILGAVLVGSGIYWFKDKLLSPSGKSRQPLVPMQKPSASLPKINKTARKTRDFVEKMRETDKTVIFFYGSQTGTAEDYAARLAKEGTQRYNLRTMTADLEDYDMNLLDTLPANHLAVFVLATYGEGEPTDNAAEFWEHLVTGEDLPEFSRDDYEDAERPLSDVHYVVFGLGNKTYEHYNAVCRRVDEKLTKLGATRIGDRGEGDDDGSLEEDFLSWKDDMWKAVCDFMGIDFFAGNSGPRQATYMIQEHTKEEVEALAKVYFGEYQEPKFLVGSRPTYDSKYPYPATIPVSRQLFSATAGRRCLHMEVDISGSGITYQTGDHIAVWPVNAEHEVEKLARVLGLTDKLDTIITVSNTDPGSTKLPFPVPTTYRTILRHYVDITAPPSRAFIGQLTPFAPSEETAKVFAHWGQDKEAFRLQVADARRSLGTVLEKILGPGQTMDIPFDLLIESVPRLQARYYSISSSSKAHPTTIHLTAVILDYKPDVVPDETVYGLATNFLHNCHAHINKAGAIMPKYEISGPKGSYLHGDSGIKVPIHVRHSNFKLPRNSALPIIMVGPGTGVAPFRGFIQDRAADAKNGKKVGATVLFFGCRREDEDYLYKDEWPELIKDIEGAQIITAFSRQPGMPKTYVQHKMNEHKELIWDLIHKQGGYFYVCGDAKNMAREVNHRLIEIAMTCGEMSEEKATNYIKELRGRGRYEEDVWS